MKNSKILFFLFFLGPLFSTAQLPVYPKSNQVLADSNITFVWDAVPSADFYQIQIASDSLFQSVILDSNGIMNNILINNLSFGSYYWKYRTNVNSQYQTWSEPIYFSVFSPKAIDSLVLWLAADSGITKDVNNKVTQWNDLSGNGNNASQLSIALQPIFQDSILGSNPSVSFIGNNYIISGQYSILKPGNKNRSIVIFFDNQYATGYNIPFVNFDYGYNSYYFFEPLLLTNRVRLYLGDGSSYSLKNFYANFSSKKITSTIISNSITNIYLNSSYLSQQVYNLGVDSVDMYALGGRTYNGTSCYHPFNGKVFEIIDYAKPLDSAEIQLVNKYLLDKYTPPVNLGQNILRRYGFCDTTLATEEMYESYLWSTGDTTRSISISKEDTGWYWCEVPNLFGDLMRDSVYVYDLIGRPNLRDTIICYGDSSFISLPPTYQPTNLLTYQPTNLLTYNWRNSSNITVSTDSVLVTSIQDVYSLQVADTLGCFITDTVQVLVDSFEVQASLGPDKSLCSGDKIGLITGQAQADSFLWSTGSTDSLLQINTAGTYSLIVQDTNSCIAKDTISVAIHGITPHVSFWADTACFRDSTLFLDSSYALDQSNLINWKWEFGDGNSLQSPVGSPQFHLFPDSGFYTVKLTVSTDSNCSNFAYRDIYVRPLPEPNFYPLTGCQNLDIQFQNLSIYKDTLITWHWDFGDSTYSALEAPIKAFKHSIIHPVLLRATNQYGCGDSIYKNVDIKPSPQANFSYSNVCNGTPVHFADQSQTLPYNPIMTHEWNIDGTLSGAETPTHIFPSSGYFPTKLKVTALNACWDTITLSVKVNAIPQAGFTLSNACSGSATQFRDTSVVKFDTINAWYWVFDHGWSQSTVEGPQITFNDTLIHHATLRVKSAAGCEDSTAQTFKIYPSPTAAFTMDREYGLPPLTVNFTSWSLSGVEGPTPQPTNLLTYLWSFGDGSLSTVEAPTHIYTDSTIFHPQLLVENTYGCKDSISHPVYVIYAAVDIALIEVTSSIDGEYARFSCVIENRGQQKIKQMDLSANYNGGQPIQEQWSGELLPGQKTTYVFQAKVKVQGNPAYYCITATPITDIDDEYPADNMLCKEYEAKLWVGRIFPNPATDFINIDVILPVNQEIMLSISNMEGKQLQSVNIKANRGLNQLKINTTSYPAGIYQLKIESGADSEVRRFIIL